jgi:Ca2+-binding EF-hand superfamily protein
MLVRYPEEKDMINKAMFEDKWKLIRGQSAEWWSLMAEYDLVKVDKADVKFDKFVTMLQVKYGYTRQKAREEINRLWTEYEARNKTASV